MRLKRALLVTTALTILLSIIFLFFHKNQTPPISTMPPQVSLQEQPTIIGFEFTKYVSGKKYFTLTAEKFYLRDRKVKYLGFRIPFGKSSELEAIKVTFYKDNIPVSYLSSRNAFMDMKRKNILFEGDSMIITQDKSILSANKIFWQNADMRLRAEGDCFLGEHGRTYTDNIITTDAELKNFKIGEG
jgi:hypothetical protein